MRLCVRLFAASALFFPVRNGTPSYGVGNGSRYHVALQHTRRAYV